MAVQIRSTDWMGMSTGFLLGIFALLVSTWANATAWSDVHVTDVTPRSFTVVWQATEAATGTVEVFRDVMGAESVADATIVPMPLGNGDQALKNQMINAGTIRVRVSSLRPATPYFFRLVTTPTATGVDEVQPSIGPYRSVVTARGNFVVSNISLGLEVLQPDGSTPAPGSLVITRVDDSAYPLSSVAGDGYAGGFAGANLSNLYPDSQLSNRELSGGENARLSIFAKSSLGAEVSSPLQTNFRQAALQDLGTSVLGNQTEDIDEDGMPDAWEESNSLVVGVHDAGDDADGDGLTNLEEYQHGTDPQAVDSDGDNLEDGEELSVYGTLPSVGDSDRDGVLDGEEIDVAIDTDPLVADSDGDGVGDGDEILADTDPNDPGDTPVLDEDGDGTGDLLDNCPRIPNPSQSNTDGDQYGDACDNDDDGDGIPDGDDNAPNDANPGQEDEDLDGVGDVGDNCPMLFNPEQRDNDGDGNGNDCDADDDNDGIDDMSPAGAPSELPYQYKTLIGLVADNLPAVGNEEAYIAVGKRDYATSEKVTIGFFNLRTRQFKREELTATEEAMNGTLTLYVDTNNCDCIELQPRTFITLETDLGLITAYLPERDAEDDPIGTIIADDGSSYASQYVGSGNLAGLLQSSQVPTPLDNCQFTYNPGQSDVDGDGIGDLCDATPDDVDGDGVLNSYDNCPDDHNPDQANFDGDAQGNVCDLDNDNDGLEDVVEAALGSGHLNSDSDGDGIPDGEEDFDLDGTSNADELARGSNPLVSDVRFEAGLNYFSFPTRAPDELTASQLVAQLGGQLKIASVRRYDRQTGTAQGYEWIDGAWEGDDFPLVSGEGYFIEMLSPVETSYDTLRTCMTFNLQPGANVTGFSCITGGMTAFELLEMLGGPSAVTTVQRYNREFGRFESAGYSDSQPVGVDFKLNNQEAYIVNMKASADSFRLSVAYPALSVTSHTFGETVSSPEAQLSGLVNDVNALVMVDGVLADSQVSGNTLTFNAPVTLTEGTNEIELLTRSGQNLVSIETFRLNYAVPPEFSIDSHTDGQTVYGSSITLLGTISDSNATVTANGVEGTVIGNGFEVASIPLRPGINMIEVSVTGDSGGQDTQIIALNYQPLEVTVPAGGSAMSSVTISVPSDLWSDFTSFSWSPTLPTGLSHDNEGATRLSSPDIRFSYSFSADAAMAPGEYEASVSYDLKNGTGDILLTKVFDYQIEVIESSLPPTVSITEPAEGATVETSPYTVSGNVSDSGATVTVNGISATVTGNSFSANIPLTEGTNSITVVAENVHGTTTETINVNYVDDPSPSLTVGQPVDGQVLNQTNITVSGTVEDADSLTVNGISATITGTSYTADIVLSEGNNTITVVATNGQGSTEQNVSVSVVLDTPEELTVTVGGSAIGQRDFVTTTALWGEIANFRYSPLGMPSFLSFTHTGATLVSPNIVQIPYTVDASGIATPGDYSFSVNFEFLDGSGDVLFNETLLLNVHVTP